MKQKGQRDYWMKSAEDDISVMEHLLASGDYLWSLFIGHLILEKMLKALVVHATCRSAPFIHNLPRLAQDAGLSLTPAQENLLIEMMRFHIEARYPAYKEQIRKIATKKFTSHKVKQIKEITQWLKNQIKS
jgi:HEPN domain-containing protein